MSKRRRRQILAWIMVGLALAVLALALVMGRKQFGEPESTGPFGGRVEGVPMPEASDGKEGIVAHVVEEPIGEPIRVPEESVTESETEPFAEQIPETEAAASMEATIIFTGDVMLSDYVLQNYDSAGIDGVVAQELGEILRGADVLEINHEFPFSLRGEQAPDKQYTFRVDPKYVKILQEMGVDVAGLANNHALDYGPDALLDTVDTLSGAGISTTGAGADSAESDTPVILDVNGLKIGFVAATHVIPLSSWSSGSSHPGLLACYDTTRTVNVIRELREQCDYVFVCVHWGVEKTTELTDYQPVLARTLIDAGADGVIGSHSHCLQPVEFYNGRPIFYSLGNFVFNYSIGQTAAVRMHLTQDTVDIQMIPAYAQAATTCLATGDRAQEIYSALREMSPGISIDSDGNLFEK